MVRQEELQNALDRLDTLFTLVTLTAESDQHEPGRKELRFFADSGVEVLDEILRVIRNEEGAEGSVAVADKSVL